MENQREPLRIKFLEKPLPQAVSKKLSYFFRFINIYLCLDFGFIEIKSFVSKFLFKTFLLFQSCAFLFISIGLLYLGQAGDVLIVWYLTYNLQYILFVCILIFSREKTLKEFIIDLHALDSAMGVDSYSFNTDIYIIVGVIFLNIYRMLTNIVVCIYGGLNLVGVVTYYFLYLPPFFANEVIVVVGVYIFYSVSCRIKKFTSFVSSGSASIVTCEYIYKDLADITDDVMKNYLMLFSSCLIFCVPAEMIAFVMVLSQITDQLTVDTNIAEYLNILLTTSQSVILIAVVAIFGGKLAAEVAKMRFELIDFLEKKDQRHTFDLKRLVRYVEVRPFTFKACQIIPVDYTLPFAIINLCITYIIIVIQFWHFTEK